MSQSRPSSPTRPNEFTQLSFFSDMPDAIPVDNLEEESTNARDGRPDTARIPDSGTLDQVPAQDGRDANGPESTPAGDLRSAGADGQSALRTGGGGGDGISDRLGVGDEGVGLPSGRGGSAPTIVRSRDARPQATLTRDYRITSADQVGGGSLREKAQANLAAIRVLKKIESEDRIATPEEKAVLVKFTGWGAMPGAFELQPSRDWKGIAQELREVLGAEEYASARASTPNAHYTSPEVIHAIWKAMERFGFQPGGHVLEPSMGVGHFFGLMPEGLYPGTRRTGVELDSITARIAAKLYPDSNVHGKGLEDVALPRDFFDAAVGNIPFGNYPVFDPAYRRSPHLTRGIHDYFLAKSLDVVRPGGLVALITSRYTMDKQDPAVREHLAEGAVLLGALRLPNTAFRANAGTDVTTDILFLQKRSSRVRQEGERWTELAPLDTPDGKLQINEYFVRNPEMMLGRMGLESAQYGATPALIGSLTTEILANAISRLPAAIYTSAERQTPALCVGEA